MSPPPSTPTPRRFLLPKRALQQPGRFRSTPRFGPPSSVPRPTQATRGIEDVDDDEDEERVEVSSVEGDGTEGKGRRARDVLGDSIEVLSDESSGDLDKGESRDGGMGMGDVVVPSPEETPLSRETKRRKLSISPLPAFGSPSESQEPGSRMGADDGGRADSGDEQPRGSYESSNDEYPSEAEIRPKAQQQPTFQRAPRFKQLDAEGLGEGLPAAFSPQRRGAKYLTGGLAAELQGWLSEVKGEDGFEGCTFRVTVAEVRAGRRMYMVRGNMSDSNEPRGVILAGEGRLTGLGRRAVVEAGTVVEVGQPVWDVEVGGETWMVACDWTVP